MSSPIQTARPARQIAEFREQHEPHRAAFVPAHITLVFGVSEPHLPTITQQVETAAQQFKSCNITLDRHTIAFDPFENKHKIFFLCGAGQDTLTALHEHLYRGPHHAELSPEPPFRPHMTVGGFDTRAQAEKINITQTLTLPILADIDALRIVRFADGALTPLKTLPLRN